MTDYINYCPFPIGSIFITTSVELPSAIWQNTYRVPFGKGRCLVCVDDQNESLKNVETQFGSAGLSQQDITQGEEGGTVKVTTGASNYQPSITVYIWKRVRSRSEMQTYNAFNIPETTPQEIKAIYGDNVIIDYNTMKPKQPDPYNPSPAS